MYIMKRLLLLFLLLSFLFPHKIFAHSEVQIIEMTENGFEPDAVTVDQNSTIIFLNKDTQPHWPASNPHPTHELYPEFDPRQEVVQTESWSFRPKKIGTWKYHDHLFPHIKGVITVKAETNAIVTQNNKTESIFTGLKNSIAKFFTNIKNFFAYKKEKQTAYKPPTKDSFKKLSADKQTEDIENIAKKNPQKAWQYIKDVFEKEAGSSGSIHDLAHLSGNLLYKGLGFKGIASCGREFAFGCYHGFLDEAFAKNLDLLLDAEESCLQLNAKNNDNVSGPAASCIHGIGHGIASYYGTKDLPSSLRTCRKLTKGKEYCFDGVFMEFVRSSPKSFYKENDLLYPCNELENEYGYAYSLACGRNQPSVLMGRFTMPFEDVSKICVNSTSKPFKEGCIDALGFSLAATLDTEKIIQGCNLLNETALVSTCIQKAAGELVFQDVPSWQEKTQILCMSIPENKGACESYISNLASDYGRRKQ